MKVETDWPEIVERVKGIWLTLRHRNRLNRRCRVTTVYTTAPTSLDYGFVRSSTVIGSTESGQEMRRVQVMSGRFIHYQLERYRSGIYWASEDKAPARQLISRLSIRWRPLDVSMYL